MLEVSAEQKHQVIMALSEKYNIFKNVNKSHNKSYNNFPLIKSEETQNAYQQQLP